MADVLERPMAKKADPTATRGTRISPEMYEYIYWITQVEDTTSAQLLDDVAGRQLKARYESHQVAIDILKKQRSGRPKGMGRRGGK